MMARVYASTGLRFSPCLGIWRAALVFLQSPALLLALALALCAASSVHAQSKPGTAVPIVTPIPGPDAIPPPPDDPDPGVFDDSAVVDFSAPTSMTTGSTAWVTVTMRNIGNTTWSSSIADPYRIGIFNPIDSLIWGIGRSTIGGTVTPNSLVTFSFSITAPTTPGSYSFDWRMLREGQFWFGAIATRTITVTAPTPVYDAQLINASVPANMTAGSTYNVSLTFKNTGNVTWSQAANYRIGSTNPVDNMTFGRNRVDMNVATVAPGQSATFDFQVQAPASTGNHLFDWGMLWEGQRRFGQTTARTVTVSAPVPKPVIEVAHIPSPVAASNFTTYWNASNATSLTRVCTASGTGFKVNESLAVGGNRTQTAQAAWVGYPSSCTWTATGAGGSTTYTEVVTTAPAPATKPAINVSRNPAPVAGQSFTTSWSTSNATSLSRVCTASGSGYTVNESLAVNGSRTDTAQAAWVGYPSSCTWTANGTGGTTTYTETMTTAAAPTPKPTISVTRTPAPVAGQSFTTTWSTSNASSLSRVCTASGTGYTVNETLAVNGSRTDTASAAWVGYPSSCTWTASGAGGTSTHVETMTTTAPVSSGVTYIHTDGLGSPVARTNAAGQVISRTRYEPYGYVADGAQPTVGFTGHVNDADTGLTYMQQRYYDPVAGRFLSIDPVTTDVNVAANFNRYYYGNNNPLRYIDPDGRFSEEACRDMVGNCQTFGALTYNPNSTSPELRSSAQYHFEIMGKVLENALELYTNAILIVVPEISALKASPFVGLTVAEITAINRTFGGVVAYRPVENVIANAQYYPSTIQKIAAHVRDIAGAHLFNDGNKRTAAAVVQELAVRNGIRLDPAKIRAVINDVAESKIKTVEDIAKGLK